MGWVICTHVGVRYHVIMSNGRMPKAPADEILIKILARVSAAGSGAEPLWGVGRSPAHSKKPFI